VPRLRPIAAVGALNTMNDSSPMLVTGRPKRSKELATAGSKPRRARGRPTIQYRTVVTAVAASCPQTKLHTPAPAAARPIETPVFIAAPITSGISRPRKSSRRRSSACGKLEADAMRRPTASTRVISASAGSPSAAARKGASPTAAPAMTTPKAHERVRPVGASRSHASLRCTRAAATPRSRR
jgi:hypothetical protein